MIVLGAALLTEICTVFLLLLLWLLLCCCCTSVMAADFVGSSATVFAAFTPGVCCWLMFLRGDALVNLIWKREARALCNLHLGLCTAAYRKPMAKVDGAHVFVRATCLLWALSCLPLGKEVNFSREKPGWHCAVVTLLSAYVYIWTRWFWRYFQPWWFYNMVCSIVVLFIIGMEIKVGQH